MINNFKKLKMNPTGNYCFDHNNNIFYPQYTIQNFECNFNLVQPSPFNQSQSNYTRPEYPYGNLNQSSLGFEINAPYKVTQRQPLQCIFDSNSQNILNQNGVKYNLVNGYPNCNMNYQFNKGVNYQTNMMKMEQEKNNFDPILMHPPGSLLPTVDNLERKPDRQTHENCTTFKYNRKSSIVSSPRSYKCSYLDCNKAYMKSSHLKAHMRIHSGEKPHICKYIFPDGTNCTESFVRSDQLTRHRRRHENDKPFQCQQCLKKFYRSDHCKTHQDRCRMKTNSIFSI